MEKYKKVFDLSKGVIKTSDFVKAGYNRAILLKLLKSNHISGLQEATMNGTMMSQYLML